MRPRDDLLTLAEAAHALGISRQSLWRWRKDGTLRVIRVGKLVRVERAEVARLLPG